MSSRTRALLAAAAVLLAHVQSWAACAGGYASVCAAGCNFTTITAAVNGIPASALTGDYCVDVKDNGPYNEQVVLQGKNPNGFQIVVGTTTGAARPVVNPPVGSTAAFQVANASVTLANVLVEPSAPVQYGIWASSAYVTVSSVDVVDPGGSIWGYGLAITSASAVSYSSVTVAFSTGVYVTGSLDSVSYSSAQTSSGAAALYLNGASSGTFTVFFASSSLGAGIALNGANSNTITLSTAVVFSPSSSSNVRPLLLVASSSNTVSRSYFSNPVNQGASLTSGSNSNTLSQDTFACGGATATCLKLDGVSLTLVTKTLVENPAGDAVLLMANGASFNTISQTSVTANGGYGLTALRIDNSPNNTVTQSYIANPTGIAAYIYGSASTSNTIGQSTVANNTAGSANVALTFSGTASNNLITQTYVSNPQGYGVSIDYGCNNNTISLSTVATGGAPPYDLAVAIGLANGASGTLITQSYLTNPNGMGAHIGGDHTTISFSTITSNTTADPALKISGNATSILNSYVQGASAVLVKGATGTVVDASVVVATNTSGTCLQLTGGSSDLSMSSNTLIGSSQGTGVALSANNGGTIVLSTNSVLAGLQYGIWVATQSAGSQVWITSNTIVPTVGSGASTYGLYLNGLTSGATIENNAIVYRNAGSMGANTAYGLYAQSASGLNIDHNRIDEPGMVTAGSFVGAYFNGAQNVAFKFNDVSSTGTSLANGYLLQLSGSTVVVKDDVFFSSFGVTGSSATIWVDATSGGVSDYNDLFSSNSLTTLSWGSRSYQFPWSVQIGQDAHSISANPFWANPSSGVEDFHPLSLAGRCSNPPACTAFANDGASSPTIDAGDPAEPFGLEPNPNGGRVNQGSFGDTSQASESASPPASPVVSAVYVSSVTVSWGAAPSAGYLLQASTASDFSGALFSSATANPALTQLTLQGLAGSTTYFLRVGATYGAVQVLASAVPALTLALAPGGSQLYAVWPTSITVNWVAVSTQAASYDVEASTMPGFSPLYASSATMNVSLSTLTLSGLALNATFYFRVGSFNWAGTPAYAVVGSTYLATPPASVSNLATLPSTSTDRQAILTWTAPGAVFNLGTAASYNIRYAQSLITPANFGSATVWKAVRPVSGPSGTAETETITGLSSSVTYYFALETANSSGNVSGLSNVVSYLTGQDVIPGVTAITPPYGTVVLVSTTVAIFFNKAMSTATFGGVTVTAVQDNNGNPINQLVAGTTSYLAGPEALVFTPSAPLTKGTVYQVAVATAVQDTAGTAVSSVTASFATVFDHALTNAVFPGQGARFNVPANAFSSDGGIFLTTAALSGAAQTATQKLLALDNFSNPVSVLNISAVDASGNSMQPGVALTATLPFSSTLKPGVVDNTSPPVRSSTLALWWLDPATQTWVRLPGGSVQGASLVARLPHFSTFALIGGQDTSLQSAYAFPVPYVPAKQSTRVITFQNLSSTARIRIFTLSGRLAREIDSNDGSGKAVWDVKNSQGQDAASGLYIYLIENGAESRKGELVIVR